MASGLGLSIEVRGDQQIARDLIAMRKRGADPRPFFRETMEELRQLEPEWFESHGHHTWPELDAYTIEDKNANGLPLDPLVRSGALERSLTERTSPDAIRTATKAGMHFGTKVWYARVHQRSKRASLPRRDPLVKMTHHKRRELVNELTSYLLGKRKGPVV